MGDFLKHGEVVRTSSYFKTCNQDHFMNKFQGFGISSDELSRIVARNVNFVLIRFNGDLYFSTLKKWLDSELTHVDKDVHGRDDLQHFVSLKDMVKL